MVFSPNALKKKVYKLSFGHNDSNIADIPVKRPAFLWAENLPFGSHVMESQSVFIPPPHLLSVVFLHRCPLLTGSVPPLFLSNHKFLRLSAGFSELTHHPGPESLGSSLKHRFWQDWSFWCALDAGHSWAQASFLLSPFSPRGLVHGYSICLSFPICLLTFLIW